MKHAMFPYQLVQDFFHRQICLSSSWIFGLFWKDILYPDPNLPPTLKSCHTFSPHNGTMSNKNTLFPLKKNTGKSHAFYPWVSKKPGSCREIRKPSFVSVPSQGFHANRCDSTCHCGSTAGRSLKKTFQLRFVEPSKFHWKPRNIRIPSMIYLMKTLPYGHICHYLITPFFGKTKRNASIWWITLIHRSNVSKKNYNYYCLDAHLSIINDAGMFRTRPKSSDVNHRKNGSTWNDHPLWCYTNGSVFYFQKPPFFFVEAP